MLLDEITFVFQIHNRQDTVSELLNPFLNCHCIVYNDGSADNTKAVIDFICRGRANIIVKHTDNLYETEITHDAFQLAKTPYVCLIQDDDYYYSLQFAKDAAFIFNFASDIAALSPKHGVIIDPKNLSVAVTIGKFLSTDSKMAWPTFNEYGLQYVDVVDRAPLFIRLSSYTAIGGVDRELLRGGYNDWDMCLRWKQIGQRVALYRTCGYEFRYWDAGTLRPGSDIRAYHNVNHDKVYLKHKAYLDTL